jgi:hypothetical protein
MMDHSCRRQGSAHAAARELLPVGWTKVQAVHQAGNEACSERDSVDIEVKARGAALGLKTISARGAPRMQWPHGEISRCAYNRLTVTWRV